MTRLRTVLCRDSSLERTKMFASVEMISFNCSFFGEGLFQTTEKIFSGINIIFFPRPILSSSFFHTQDPSSQCPDFPSGFVQRKVFTTFMFDNHLRRSLRNSLACISPGKTIVNKVWLPQSYDDSVVSIQKMIRFFGGGDDAITSGHVMFHLRNGGRFSGKQLLQCFM